jgi:hypothetical protein
MFSAGPVPIRGGVYESICDTGLDPVVPALVLGGVSTGVLSRTTGEAGSFAGRSLEEELADAIFFTRPTFEGEGEAASPRLKKLSESTAHCQPCYGVRGSARSYLEACGEKACLRVRTAGAVADHSRFLAKAVASTSMQSKGLYTGHRTLADAGLVKMPAWR